MKLDALRSSDWPLTPGLQGHKRLALFVHEGCAKGNDDMKRNNACSKKTHAQGQAMSAMVCFSLLVSLAACAAESADSQQGSVDEKMGSSSLSTIRYQCDWMEVPMKKDQSVLGFEQNVEDMFEGRIEGLSVNLKVERRISNRPHERDGFRVTSLSGTDDTGSTIFDSVLDPSFDLYRRDSDYEPATTDRWSWVARTYNLSRQDRLWFADDVCHPDRSSYPCGFSIAKVSMNPGFRRSDDQDRAVIVLQVNGWRADNALNLQHVATSSRVIELGGCVRVESDTP